MNGGCLGFPKGGSRECGADMVEPGWPLAWFSISRRAQCALKEQLTSEQQCLEIQLREEGHNQAALLDWDRLELWSPMGGQHEFLHPIFPKGDCSAEGGCLVFLEGRRSRRLSRFYSREAFATTNGGSLVFPKGDGREL